jgi:hypothetical protein
MEQSHIDKLNTIALEMLANNYFFKCNDSFYPAPRLLGDCHVCAVVINENSAPEILLLKSGSDNPDFYHLEDLEVSLSVSFIGLLA